MMQPLNTRGGSVLRLIDTAAHAASPAPLQSVSDWAYANIVIPDDFGPEPGQLRKGRTPYLDKIMDTMGWMDQAKVVDICAGSQLGKSLAMQIAMMYAIKNKPAPMGMMRPSEKSARRWVEKRFEPMVRTTQPIKKLFGRRGPQVGKSLLPRNHPFKYDVVTFPGGSLYPLWAGSENSFAELSLRYLFMDEIDRYEMDVNGEGSPIALANARTTAFGDRAKIVRLSTPTIKGQSHIWAGILESDLYHYWVPCPHCGQMMRLTQEELKYDGRSPATTAHYECERCHAEIENWHKDDMLPRGDWALWIWDGQKRVDALKAVAKDLHVESVEPTWETVHHPVWEDLATPNKGRHIGFHLSSLYSPHGWLSWGQMATEWHSANETGDRNALKAYINTRLAEPFETRGGDKLEPHELTRYVVQYERPVPKEVAVLTAAVDTQDYRLEVLIVGWDIKHRPYHILHEVIPGMPMDPAVRAAMDQLLFGMYDGMRVEAAAVDVMGHNYKWMQPHMAQRAHLRRNFFPIHGAKGKLQDPLWVRGHRTAYQAKRKVHTINTHAGHDAVWASIVAEPGAPGALVLPRWIDSTGLAADHDTGTELDKEYFRQLAAEQMVRNKRGAAEIIDFEKVYDRNEIFDLYTYNHAMIDYLVGVLKIDLEAKLVERHAVHSEMTSDADAPVMRESRFLRRSDWAAKLR